MKQQDVKQLGNFDWNAWKGKDPATLVFVIRDGEILLINKKTGRLHLKLDTINSCCNTGWMSQ